MKKEMLITFVLAACLLFPDSSALLAQTTKEEKSKAEAPASSVSEKVIPLKIQVLLTEFDGAKKVKSLPYISYVTASSEHAYEFTKIRLGTKVPVYTGKESGMQYIDVGTNIDCRARHAERSTRRQRSGR